MPAVTKSPKRNNLTSPGSTLKEHDALQPALLELRDRAARYDEIDSELTDLGTKVTEQVESDALKEKLLNLESEFQLLRFKAQLFDEINPELTRLRDMLPKHYALESENAALRAKAEQSRDLELELPSLRYRAARFEQLAREAPLLHLKAAAYDELERSVGAIRAKAEQFDAVEPQLEGLRRQAQQCAEFEARLATLQHQLRAREEAIVESGADQRTREEKIPEPVADQRAESALRSQLERATAQCTALEAEVTTLRRQAEQYRVPDQPEIRFKAEQYSKLQAELPSLRYKARQYDKLKSDIPVWRAKANRHDRSLMRRWSRTFSSILGKFRRQTK